MKYWLPLISLMLLSIAACQPAAEVTTSPSATSRFATVSGPITQRTLPPPWTPSPTATITRTPTATHTPSSTPTESPEDLCAGFDLMHDFTDQRVYRLHEYIPIIISLDSPNAAIHFAAVHQITGDGAGFDMPGGQTIGMEFRIAALPGPGRYDWLLSVQSETYGDLCQQEGSFRVLAATATPGPTAESTAESTAEINPD